MSVAGAVLPATASGATVGIVLGLIGGGGSILALPLLVYVVEVHSPHIAIGTSAVAVAVTALINFVSHWRVGNIDWKAASIFAGTGVIGAFAGSSIAQTVDGGRLLAGFGMLMVLVGAGVLKRELRSTRRPPPTFAVSSHGVHRLTGAALVVGLLAGFFGIGGGFLIVPALVWATGMPLFRAVGTSLFTVASFGAATAVSYAYVGMVDWGVAGLFVLGGVAGGIAGLRLGTSMSLRKDLLGFAFAIFVTAAGLYVMARSILG